jgi:hypothetical protein
VGTYTVVPLPAASILIFGIASAARGHVTWAHSELRVIRISRSRQFQGHVPIRCPGSQDFSYYFQRVDSCMGTDHSSFVALNRNVLFTSPGAPGIKKITLTEIIHV